MATRLSNTKRQRQTESERTMTVTINHNRSTALERSVINNRSVWFKPVLRSSNPRPRFCNNPCENTMQVPPSTCYLCVCFYKVTMAYIIALLMYIMYIMYEVLCTIRWKSAEKFLRANFDIILKPLTAIFYKGFIWITSKRVTEANNN